MLTLERLWDERYRASVLMLSGAIVAGIGAVDWWTKPYVSLGFLSARRPCIGPQKNPRKTRPIETWRTDRRIQSPIPGYPAPGRRFCVGVSLSLWSLGVACATLHLLDRLAHRTPISFAMPKRPVGKTASISMSGLLCGQPVQFERP